MRDNENCSEASSNRLLTTFLNRTKEAMVNCLAAREDIRYSVLPWKKYVKPLEKVVRFRCNMGPIG